MAVMALISILVTAWLGSMFVYSASLKLVRYNRGAGIVKPYRVLPSGIDLAVGFLLPWGELLGGVLLLSGQFSPVGPLLGAALGASFAYGSLRVLHRGAVVPCGCTGAESDRVKRTTLIRALLITLCSLFVLGIDQQSPARPPILISVALVSASLLPAVLSFWRQSRRARLRRRPLRHDQAEIARLLRLLADPPAVSLSNDLAPAALDTVSSSVPEEAVVQVAASH